MATVLVVPAVPRLPRMPRRPSLPRRARTAVPALFTVLNAVAFVLLRPDVPDLWAARARASAAGHGVGLTYWFGWFGGSTPGNYSVVTPWLCGVLGTETVAALSAVAASVLATVLVRGTRHPFAASTVAAFAVVVNLWCGRVPFLLGAALAVGALVCVRQRRTVPVVAATVVLSIASVLASPVAGAFLGIGLSGTLVSSRLRAHRTVAVVAVGAAGVTLVTIALLFGAPGPEPFPLYLVAEIALVVTLLLLCAPSGHLRVTLAVAGVAALVVFSFPNGMGSNLVRLALFCLPAAAVATSRRSPRVLAALTAPIILLCALNSGSAVLSAINPASSASYYAPLAGELDSVDTSNHRLELVDASHAAWAVLLDHATLARGWETQEDLARNAVLQRPTLTAVTYRSWLDDNAVGFVALASSSAGSPEARVVRTTAQPYLREVWHSARWILYAVRRPVPIVGRPAQLVTATQAAMRVRVPCACRTTVRVRWSKFLTVTALLPDGTPDAVEDSYRPVVTPDKQGWTTLTTTGAGTYLLT